MALGTFVPGTGVLAPRLPSLLRAHCPRSQRAQGEPPQPAPPLWALSGLLLYNSTFISSICLQIPLQPPADFIYGVPEPDTGVI